MRLPISDDGLIDETEVARNPAMATVKRFWPNEPDQQGYVIRTEGNWAFSYAIGEEDDEALFHLEAHALRQGEYITLTEPNGEQLPFQVTKVSSMDGSTRAFVPGPPPGD